MAVNFAIVVKKPVPLGLKRNFSDNELSGGNETGKDNTERSVNSGASIPGPWMICNVSQPLLVKITVVSCGGRQVERVSKLSVDC